MKAQGGAVGGCIALTEIVCVGHRGEERGGFHSKDDGVRHKAKNTAYPMGNRQ